jgi:hypothetical protein
MTKIRRPPLAEVRPVRRHAHPKGQDDVCFGVTSHAEPFCILFQIDTGVRQGVKAARFVW